MISAGQSSQQKFASPYDEVFNALVAAIPTLTGFTLDSQDRATGHITAKAGVTLFSRGESLQLLVDRVDDNNTIVAIETPMKHGRNSGGISLGAGIFNSLVEALKLRSRMQQLRTSTDGATPTGFPLVVGASIRIDRMIPGARTPQSLGISFSCSQCGQNIVIDRRGAGLHVNCPKCQAELTVPKAVTG